MKKLKTPLLFIVLTISLFLNFISCQKQKDVGSPQDQKQANKSSLMGGRIIGDVDRDYSIEMEKAIRFTRKFRDNKTDAEPIGYKVPVGGILELLKRVQDNNIDITHITFYQAIDDEGHRKLVYVATKADGTDVLEYAHPQTINGFTTPIQSPAYDLANDLTSGGVTNLNVLNSK